MLLLCLISIATLIFYLYLKVNRELNYWNRKLVPNFNPKTPAGDFLPSLTGKTNQYVLIWNHYKKFKENNHKFGGLYFTLGPIFFPIDLDIIKRILQTNFDYFNTRGMYHDKRIYQLSENIFTHDFETWKHIKSKLSPMFTAKKLKTIFPTILNCCNNLIASFRQNINQPILVSELFKRYSLDVYINCMLGIEDSTLKKKNSIYIEMAEKLSNHSIFDVLKVMFTEGTKNPGNFYKLLISANGLYELSDEVVSNVVKLKSNNNVNRNDLIDTLLELIETDKDKINPFSYKDLVAQVTTFFAGSFETTSILLTCTLFELGNNQEIQDKLRREIKIKIENNNNELDYEVISQMKYLDQVITETLRKYPPLPVINRYCVKDYKLPNSDIVIEKDTPVVISVLGIHYDPEYFPNPEKFDPERYDGNDAPYLLTFGQGPRNCIAKRLGVLESKMAIIQILRNFKISVNEKTGPKLIIDNIARHLVLQFKNSILIDFKENKLQ